MNTCDSCVFWSDKARFNQPNRYISRQCVCPKLVEGFYEETIDALHYSYEEDGQFYTDPKFGCVHHKARTA